MQIPILNGIYTDNNSSFRTSYPRNLEPTSTKTGINKGYLKPASGIVESGSGPGVDRGGINWRDECYRVMGSDLVKIDNSGNYSTIGTVGGSGYVSMTYGFNYLAVVSSGLLFLYDGSTFSQVTDPDLGIALDVTWVDGYFMTTDGESLVVTELNDSFSINPTKYGSSEADPDPVIGLENIRNEVYVKNRYTIEVFSNIGSSGFPFQRIEGAQIEKGVVGTHASKIYMGSLAFVGSGRNEAPAVYVAKNGQSLKISTMEIDRILKGYKEAQLKNILCDTRKFDNHDYFYIHLPDKTLVYDHIGSQTEGVPIWFTLDSGLSSASRYRAQNFVWCYDKWLCGDPISGRYGYLDDSISSHYGLKVQWEFSTIMMYSESRGAIIHSIELVSLTGSVALGDNPVIHTQYSLDGQNFSNPDGINVGTIGDTSKRIQWRRQGNMSDRRIQKFFGSSDSHISIVRLEMKVEPLYV